MLVALCLGGLLAVHAALPLSDVKVFQLPPGSDPHSFVWPELNVPEIAAKPPHALCFSGGGSRAYMLTLGVLRGLTDLGILDKFRYIGAASGGGWASAAFTYFQPNRTTKARGRAASTDEALLGNVTYPQDLTKEGLRNMAPGCLRGATKEGVLVDMVKEFIDQGFHFQKAFVAGVHRAYLELAGIPPPFPESTEQPALFSYSQDTVLDAQSRNPALQAFEFILPPPNRPLMTLGFTLLGPASSIPFDRYNRSYEIIEVNSLFTGRPILRNTTYLSSSKPPATHLIGGAIETFAFGGDAPRDPSQRLEPSQAFSSLHNLSVPSEPFTLSHAAAAGGWALADEIAAHLGPLAPTVDELIGMNKQYWSPAAGGGLAEPFVLGDAGITENDHLISLLRREELTSFVVCVLSSVPMKGKDLWDPASGKVTQSDIDDTIPNYFGLNPDPAGAPYTYSKNHVFETNQFVPFAQDLQAAAAAGNGAVATKELRVVDNENWGIRGGRSVNVTMFYLARAFNWEDQLPEFLKREVVPKGAKDPSVLPGSLGKFPKFPHIPTAMLGLNYEQSNLLSNFAGWIVKENKELFCGAVGAAC